MIHVARVGTAAWHNPGSMGGTMRSLNLSLFAIASLAGCTDTGAHLTFSAPQDPGDAKTFEVVLAAHDYVPEVSGQRASGDGTSSIVAHYFLQKTLAGAVDTIDKLDGFTVRIAPDGSTSETQFIPFVLVYDSDKADKKITAIATYRAADTGMPVPILVMPDEISKYTVDVENVTQVDAGDADLAPGELRVVTCFHDDQTPYTSGIVWRARAGQEIRLLLPNDGGIDATGRELDMDCDGHAVTPDSSHLDCDDTRNEFHRGAPDVCDGRDTNCDGARTFVEPCDDALAACPTNPFGVSGVRLCDDQTGVSSVCQATATCACSAAQSSCHVCTVPFEASLADPTNEATIHPCHPATGTLATRLCDDLSRCDVEVVGVRGGWKVKISEPTQNAFGSRAHNVGKYLAIQVERPEGPQHEMTGGVNQPTADIDLALITADATHYVPVQLRFEGYQRLECPAIPEMTCY